MRRAMGNAADQNLFVDGDWKPVPVISNRLLNCTSKATACISSAPSARTRGSC